MLPGFCNIMSGNFTRTCHGSQKAYTCMRPAAGTDICTFSGFDLYG
jgi:hypothetical protein